MPGDQDARERASRYRASAARLRGIATLASGKLIGPDYVEGLARDFDRYAEGLENPVAETTPLPE